MVRHWFTTYLIDHYSKNRKIGLDIGCGKKPYKEIYNCKYVGTDLKKSNSDHKPDFYAVGENLPFAENTFDFVSCLSVIPYVEHIDQFLDEMYRVVKNNGIVVITIMNLKALAKDPNGYYPNKFSSKQLQKKLSEHGFRSIKLKNLKASVWSTYFDLTSVYSYAIVKCIKNNPNILKKQKSDSLTSRQSVRNKIISNRKLYNSTKFFYRKYCSLTHPLHVLPDFLIIGAAKCGTSSLYDYLMQHPNVGNSLTKQIHYFDRYYDRKISWYKVCFPYKWKKFYVEKIKHMKFVTGEATAHYMTHPLAAQRAFQIVPNAKIIVMLRDPVSRAYSHYQMEKANNNEDLSFEEAIEKEPERIKGEIEEMFENKNNSGRNYPHRSYLKSGEYLEQIKRWREFYPKENFLFIKSEEFNKNPSLIYKQVLEFLNLPDFDLKKYEKIRKRDYKRMDPKTRIKLIEYFQPFNTELYEYLERDFEWN